MRYIVMNWIAFGRVWILCMLTVLRRLDATTNTHATNVRARAKLKDSNCKVL